MGLISDDGSDSDSSTTEVSDDENNDGEWTRHFTNLQFNDFTEQPGPVLPDGFDVEMASPIDYFWLLFSQEMFSSIAVHTNNYARWCMNRKGEDDDRWVDTTTAEIRAYIGINILMGICSVPEADLYWSQDDLYGNQGIQKTMTCNRFNKLSQYFHVSDRASEPRRVDGHDKLYKVRPVLDHVAESFKARYTLSREVSVDEAMVRFTGRLAFRQYMPAKPIKRGFKIWMLCDAHSAYLHRFNVYLGRQNNQTEHGLGYNVVTKLVDDMHQSHRHVYFDNYFTGVPLMTSLLDNGLYACGTVRVNRKEIPKTLKKPPTVKKRGEFMVLQKGSTNLTATVWKDKKLVYNLSTLSPPTAILDAQRRVGPTVLQLQQPHTVHSYNRYMGGVDLHDQYRMNYEVGRNSKKWWRYLFWFVINCSLVNAFLLYKEASRRITKKKRFTHLDFRRELTRDLIGGYSKRKRSGVELDTAGLLEVENIAGHVFGKLPGPRRRCRYHLTQLKQRKETCFGCTVCKVHLCRDGCHNRYHNL